MANVDPNKLYDLTLHYDDGEEETYWELTKSEIEDFMNGGFPHNLDRYEWKPSENQPNLESPKDS